MGSAGIFSGALTIIAFSVPLQKRPIYSSVATGMYGVASVAGPLLGGLFTDKVSWRLCFSINLPLGAIAIVMVSSFLSDPRRMNDVELGWELLERFDITGNILFISAIICLLLALQWGGSKYSWSDGRIIALLVIFGVLTAVFVAIQIKKQESATVPPRIVKNRSMMSAILCAGFIGASFFIVLFYVSSSFTTRLPVHLVCHYLPCISSPLGSKSSEAFQPSDPVS
jgi:MFS family permease